MEIALVPALINTLFVYPNKRYFAGIDINTPWGYYGRMDNHIKKRVLRRMQIIKGQLGGLEKMIVDEKYCIDIITQSSAIKHALSGVEDLILENHLATHATMQMRHGHGKQATAEILKVYKLSKRL